MIRINLIRLHNGQVVGESASCRWNIDVLRSMNVDLTRPMTKGQLDHARRRLKALGFALSVRAGTPDDVLPINDAEYELIKGHPMPDSRVA